MRLVLQGRPSLLGPSWQLPSLRVPSLLQASWWQPSSPQFWPWQPSSWWWWPAEKHREHRVGTLHLGGAIHAVKKHRVLHSTQQCLVCSKAELKLSRRSVGTAPAGMKKAHHSRTAPCTPSWPRASWPGSSWPLWLLSSWPQASWWVSSWPLWLLSSWQQPVAESSQHVRPVSGQASGSSRSDNLVKQQGTLHASTSLSTGGSSPSTALHMQNKQLRQAWAPCVKCPPQQGQAAVNLCAAKQGMHRTRPEQAGAQTFLAGVAALVAGLAAAILVVVFLAAGALAPVTGAFLAAFFTPVVFLATVFFAPVAAFLVAVVFLAAGFFAAGREGRKVRTCCWAAGWQAIRRQQARDGAAWYRATI